MGFKDFLKRGTGLELVTGSESQSDVGTRQSSKQRKSNSLGSSGADDKILRQLELEVSKAIEKLEDLRDKLRVRRGF